MDTIRWAISELLHVGEVQEHGNREDDGEAKSRHVVGDQVTDEEGENECIPQNWVACMEW